MNRECLYRVIAESGVLERESMVDVIRHHFPEAPELNNCYGCVSCCEDYRHHENPDGVLVELERVRQGLLYDPNYRFAEVPHKSAHNRQTSFQRNPVVLQNLDNSKNERVRGQRPHRVYINLNELSGDSKTDSQIFRDYQESRRAHVPVEEDAESVLV